MLENWLINRVVRLSQQKGPEKIVRVSNLTGLTSLIGLTPPQTAHKGDCAEMGALSLGWWECTNTGDVSWGLPAKS